MTDQTTTIAQMVFAEPVQINFARFVLDVEQVLSGLYGPKLAASMPRSDVAVFDFAGCRVFLAWTGKSATTAVKALTLGIGPSHLPLKRAIPETNHAELCSRLIERLQRHLGASAVLWHESDSALTCSLLDALTASLPKMPKALDADHPIYVDLPANPTAAPAAQPVAGELGRLRSALYPAFHQVYRPAAQIRLNGCTRDATLVMVWLPDGAEVQTFAIPSHAVTAPLPRGVTYL